MRITQFPLESDPESAGVLIEVDAHGGGMQPAGRVDDAIVKSQASLEKALATLRPTARALRAAVADIAPDEVSVELGIKLTSEATAIVVKGTGEANFVVRLTWKK